MARYWVCCEAYPSDELMMLNPLGFQVRYFKVSLEPPVNAERIREVIKANTDKEPGQVIAWSKEE